MSDLEKLGIVIKYEFLKHIRRTRLYIILGIALLAEALVLILIPTLMTGGYPEECDGHGGDAYSWAEPGGLSARYFLPEMPSPENMKARPAFCFLPILSNA